MPLAVAADASSNYHRPIRPYGKHNLLAYLDTIWQNYFADMPRANRVEIDYCHPWKGRLGLIRLSLDASTTFIGINSLLQHHLVPEYVLIVTIAHELAHYAHGFGSPLPRRYKHPHAGNVIERELEGRELGALLQCCNEWVEQEWYGFYDTQREDGWSELPPHHRRAKRQRLQPEC